jgi:cysteinyl-tRNA synthetase
VLHALADGLIPSDSVRGMSDIDARIDDKIDALETERESLRGRETSDDADELRTRLEEIRVELDRLFDWRRQRRALSAAGQDPDEAHERDASVVERYLQ